MPRRDPSAYVWDVLDACRVVEHATSGVDREGYIRDTMRRLAVERLLIIIGEAMNRLHGLDPAMGSELGEVARIVAFRNVLVHGYFKIDHAVVWDVVRDDVPALRAAAERVWSRYAHLYDTPEQTHE